MKERPIIFNDEMVRAILDGRKTQTRRIVKTAMDKDFSCELSPCEVAAEINHSLRYHFSPFGQPGDKLYVRESFSGAYGLTGMPPRDWHPNEPIWYWADGEPTYGDWTKPKPSIHMPRWAGRITLEITGVRVERLNDISEADAVAEGIEPDCDFFGTPSFRSYSTDETPCDAFCSYESLWESIYGPGSWEANPWVWVIEFRRIP